jgi:chemotaxis protein methyltransferase CheR
VTLPGVAAGLRWRTGDLLAPAQETWDLIFCCNVLIYLRPDSEDRVWRSFPARLSPGGVLVTGRAEKPPADLPLLRLHPSLYRYCP